MQNFDKKNWELKKREVIRFDSKSSKIHQGEGCVFSILFIVKFDPNLI